MTLERRNSFLIIFVGNKNIPFVPDDFSVWPRQFLKVEHLANNYSIFISFDDFQHRGFTLANNYLVNLFKLKTFHWHCRGMIATNNDSCVWAAIFYKPH
jgi:hypothetical protein